MSILDRLNEAVVATAAGQGRPCKLMKILSSDRITEQEREVFMALLNVSVGTPGRVTSVSLTNALRAEGFDLSYNAVDRHRKNHCGCSRNMKGQI